MPRQMPRRAPAAPPPSTPATTAFPQQTPPVPVFATPPGFPQDVDVFAGDPQRRREQQQTQQHRLNELAPAGFDVAAAAPAMPELGDETDVENDHTDEIRAIDFDALAEAQDEDEDGVEGELDDEDVEGDDENEEMRERRKLSPELFLQLKCFVLPY
jgi:hypothetical protein